MIKCCPEHKDYVVPLIFTFAFNYNEYWCPFCDYKCGMFGESWDIADDHLLRIRHDAYKRMSADYLHARAIQVCASTEWEGKQIPPSELPETEQARIAAILEKGWKTGVRVEEMDILTFQNKLNEQVAKSSGLDQHRSYLGISKIANCPRAAVLEYQRGITPSDEGHRMAFAGYEQEHSILRLLQACEIAKPNSAIEVIAPFDARLRGHVDGQTLWEDLLEIKSVSRQKFQEVTENHMPIKKHFIQVQLYMRYGKWKTAWVVYRCRETYEHAVIRQPYIEGQARKYEAKARLILAAIDSSTLPKCECRHCTE